MEPKDDHNEEKQSMNEYAEDYDTNSCCICLDSYEHKNYITPTCSHKLCLDCFMKLNDTCRGEHVLCPLCREQICNVYAANAANAANAEQSDEELPQWVTLIENDIASMSFRVQQTNDVPWFLQNLIPDLSGAVL